MKKRIGTIVLLLAVSLSLWGCSVSLPLEQLFSDKTATEPATLPSTEPVTEPTTVPTTEPTTAPTTEPTTATTEPTTKPVQEPANDTYLQEVSYVGAYIFSEASYDGKVVQPMPIGTYTIVKEKLDEEGNLWGKLKSGLGWICITDIRNFDEPVAIGEPDPDLKKSGKYKEYVIHDTEYAIPVVIQACRNLDVLDVYSCLMVEDDMAPEDLLVSCDSMKKGEKIVVWVEFPGDFSTYEIQALYSNGQTCRFQVATSGRNATLSVWPVA